MVPYLVLSLFPKQGHDFSVWFTIALIADQKQAIRRFVHSIETLRAVPGGPVIPVRGASTLK